MSLVTIPSELVALIETWLTLAEVGRLAMVNKKFQLRSGQDLLLNQLRSRSLDTLIYESIVTKEVPMYTRLAEVKWSLSTIDSVATSLTQLYVQLDRWNNPYLRFLDVAVAHDTKGTRALVAKFTKVGFVFIGHIGLLDQADRKRFFTVMSHSPHFLSAVESLVAKVPPELKDELRTYGIH